LKILLTGARGQVGSELARALPDAIATDRSSLDLADPDAIRRVVREAKPEAIINAAAYTAVDKAESERDLASRVNALAPGVLGEEAKRLGALLVHYSTDYVFDGEKRSPYTEDDAPNPISYYASTKLEGERAIAASGARYSIVRPSLLDGEGGYGARWLRWFARWPVHFVPAAAAGRIAVMAVTDLGEAIAALCEREASDEWRAVELGGTVAPTMSEYLRALRGKPALRVPVPPWLARLVSHLCDVAHFSPFSFGHLELLLRDNLPCPNALPRLLAREPLAVVPWSGEVLDLPAVPLRRPAL